MIVGFQKTSLVDYPDKIVSTIFFSGCNFRCPFCHNKNLVEYKEDLQNSILESKQIKKEILDHLESKKMFLDGICITGGEPTLSSDLYDFIKEIKQKNFLIKLDTNGTNPQIVEKLLSENLIDFIAMDIKGVFEKYSEYTKTPVDLENIKKTVQLIKSSNIDYEFRATVLPRLHNFADIIKTVSQLNGCNRFAIQQFRNGDTLDKEYSTEKTFTKKELELIKLEIETKNLTKQCILRAS